MSVGYSTQFTGGCAPTAEDIFREMIGEMSSTFAPRVLFTTIQRMVAIGG